MLAEDGEMRGDKWVTGRQRQAHCIRSRDQSALGLDSLQALPAPRPA
jgi:hypothetical protein